MSRREADEMGMPVSRVLASPPHPPSTRLMELLALPVQPLFWAHLFVRILQTALVPFNLMHHHPTPPLLLALQWLLNVCQPSPPFLLDLLTLLWSCMQVALFVQCMIWPSSWSMLDFMCTHTYICTNGFNNNFPISERHDTLKMQYLHSHLFDSHPW